MSHPVRVDEGRRNTVYNAIEQSGAEYLANFMELGVSSYRVEFLEETPEQVHEVIDLYNRACAARSAAPRFEEAEGHQPAWRYAGQLVK